MGDAAELEGIWRSAGKPGMMPPVVPPPHMHPQFDDLCAEYARLRAGDSDRAPNIKAAARMLANPVYFAAMLLKTKKTDAVVAGAVHTTADVIRAAKYIIGLKPGVSDVSSSFVMLGQDAGFGHEGAFIFADCSATIEPDAQTLAGVALSSADTARRLLGCEPAVALLSFSTHGSASHARIDKIRQALELTRSADPGLLVDGELQVDSAIIPEVASRKCPESPLNGRANVLVFPDLNSANIAYKLVERLAGYSAIGPLLQGLQAPMCDLSRGCKTEDILQTLTITSVMCDHA